MNKKQIFLLIKILVIVVVIAIFGRVLYKAWLDYQKMEVKPTIDWLMLSASAGVYFIALLFPGAFWHLLLKRFNEGSSASPENSVSQLELQPTGAGLNSELSSRNSQLATRNSTGASPPGLWESICAHVCGQIGKYVPGKFMVVVIRTALIKSSRTSAAVAAAAAFLETLTMMAVGAFVACLFLTYHAVQTGNWTLLAASVAMVVCAGAPTIPSVFVWIVRKIGKNKVASELLNIDKLSFGTLARGWILELFCWAGFALSYWLTLKAVGVENLNLAADFPQAIGVTAFAVSAGFLILFLPGGLGARDLAFIGLMTPWLEARMPGSGAVMATIASVVVRLVWLTTEFLAACVLITLRGGLKRGDN
ncbi:MAG: flippase-like domain-containing protein [Thermoguttaceae bacterium]|nr:flippase-like domain-containing protein [Thermoguttaceae bacterium]